MYSESHLVVSVAVTHRVCVYIGSFAVDWCQWSWKDHSVEVCSLDQWPLCLPSQGQYGTIQTVFPNKPIPFCMITKIFFLVGSSQVHCG